MADETPQENLMGGMEIGSPDVGIRRKLKSIQQTMDTLNRKMDTLMALADDLKAGIAQLDTETTAIAGLITTLAGKVKNGMTDAEVSDVKGALNTLSDRLTGLAVDPTQPVPPPSPAMKALAKKP